MRAAIYGRLSESRDGLTIKVEDQLSDGRHLATGRGWTIAGEFSDNDISALNGAYRPGYADLMAAVAAGQVDRIVVYHLSRLWRNRRERAEGIEKLKAARVSVIAVKGPELDMSTAYGRGLAGLLGEFDTMESEVKSERVARAALRRAEAGGNSGGPRAYGYTTNGLDQVPQEATEVTRIFSAFLAGVPLGAIARDLNTRQVPTVKGGPWTPASLRDVLSRARHAGLAEHKGEIVGRGQWPANVSEDTWRAADALLKNPSRRTSTGNRASYLLSGLATCGTVLDVGTRQMCGASIMSGGVKRRSNVDGGTCYQKIYKCRTCNRNNRRMDWVNEYVSAAIIGYLSRPEAVDLLIDDDRPDLDALHEEAKRLRRRLNEAAEAFADEAITEAQLRTASDRLKSRLVQIEAAQQHTSRAPILRELIEADDTRAVWESPEFGLDRQRAVVAVLVTVILHPGGAGFKVFDPRFVEIRWKV